MPLFVVCAYEQSFKSGEDVMVLSPDTDFFRYMKAPTKLRAIE